MIDPNKLTIPKIIDLFIDYKKRNVVWGIFHVCFEDKNFDKVPDDPRTEEEKRLVSIVKRLTISQRRRLAKKVDIRLGYKK